MLASLSPTAGWVLGHKFRFDFVAGQRLRHLPAIGTTPDVLTPPEHKECQVASSRRAPADHTPGREFTSSSTLQCAAQQPHTSPRHSTTQSCTVLCFEDSAPEPSAQGWAQRAVILRVCQQLWLVCSMESLQGCPTRRLQHLPLLLSHAPLQLPQAPGPGLPSVKELDCGPVGLLQELCLQACRLSHSPHTTHARLAKTLHIAAQKNVISLCRVSVMASWLQRCVP